MSNFDQELDARGLNCPLPILRAKKTLNAMSGGQILKIMATDPGSVKDFEAFAKVMAPNISNDPEEQDTEIWRSYSRILMSSNEFLYLD